MSGEARRIALQRVRLSGEIADDAVIAGLSALYPNARVDTPMRRPRRASPSWSPTGAPAFPRTSSPRTARWRCASSTTSCGFAPIAPRCAILGADAPALKDSDGFVDTGDVVALSGDRYLFVGRRGGIINVGGAKVHPEEVEAALNAHAAVRASRVFARKSPITGALVAAEIVLRDGAAADEATKRDILAACRAALPAYKAPLFLSFVAELPMTDGGKVARHG